GVRLMAAKCGGGSFERVLTILGRLVLVVASLSLAQKVLIPLVLAVLFTFILAPLVLALQRYGIGRVYAALAVVLLALVLLGGMGWGVTAQIYALAGEKPPHKTTIAQKITSLQGEGEGAIAKLLQMLKEINDDLQKTNQPPPPVEEPAPVVVKPEPAAFPSSITIIAVPLLEGLARAGLVVVLVTFMLIMREDLR